MFSQSITKAGKLLFSFAVPVVLILGAGLPAATAASATQPMMVAVADTCDSCGVISDITAVPAKKKKKHNSGLGIITGAIIGGVAGHAVGHGKTQGTTTVIGAAAGGVVGNEVAKNNQDTGTEGSSYYVVAVRMDHGGGTQTVNLHSVQGLAIGQRVKLDNGNIILE